MDQYKHQFIVIVICVVIGLLVGHYISKQMASTILINSDKQKAKLRQQVDSLKEYNSSLLRANSTLAHQYRLDSVVIRKLQYDIAIDGVRTERKLKAVDTMTNNEKVLWLTHRYSSKPYN